MDINRSKCVPNFLFLKKYRKKPIIIEAEQWFLGKKINGVRPRSLMKHHVNDMVIDTLEGIMNVCSGDWIIKGVKDELYPCKDEIFKLTYEEVE